MKSRSEIAERIQELDEIVPEMYSLLSGDSPADEATRSIIESLEKEIEVLKWTLEEE